jgi:predicted DNA-binding transcriptional regulator YafY
MVCLCQDRGEFVGCGPHGPVPGWEVDVGQAKILAVMNEQTRAQAEQLASRIWIDDDQASTRTVATLGAIEHALQERRVLAIRYRDADGRLTSRRVDPQLFASTADQWYLVAYCRLRNGLRWFRLDRIENAAVTSEQANDIPLADIGDPPATASDLTSLVQSQAAQPVGPRR